MENVAVIGGGSWGTALAHTLGGKGIPVDFWVRREELVQEIVNKRENKFYLPGITLSNNINPSSDLEKVVTNKKIILLVVPSTAVKNTIKKIASTINKDTIIVNAAKGLDQESGALLSKVISEEAGIPYANVACLSGPNHAEEISRGVPSATVIASNSIKVAELVQDILMTSFLRVYTNPDLIGVELGGALKNIIAIGVGICDGLGYGDNTRAAVMTRGLIEIARLGKVLGAKPLTFSGLSGIGDLFVTCSSNHSRNRRFGFSLGKGENAEELINKSRMVVEGYTTTKTAYNLALKNNIQMPITTEIYKILYENKNINDAVGALMERNKTNEMEDLLLS